VACQRIARGTQAMTIYKPVKQLAQRAAELAVRMARGEPIIARQSVHNGKVEVPAVLADVVTVTRGNLLQSVVADGFHPREAIFDAGGDAP
jgi:D-xylose transport system substrate-binding protein